MCTFFPSPAINIQYIFSSNLNVFSFLGMESWETESRMWQTCRFTVFLHHYLSRASLVTAASVNICIYMFLLFACFKTAPLILEGWKPAVKLKWRELKIWITTYYVLLSVLVSVCSYLPGSTRSTSLKTSWKEWMKVLKFPLHDLKSTGTKSPDVRLNGIFCSTELIYSVPECSRAFSRN